MSKRTPVALITKTLAPARDSSSEDGQHADQYSTRSHFFVSIERYAASRMTLTT